MVEVFNYFSFLLRCIYELHLESVYKSSDVTAATERLFIEVPGSPDAPYLWLKEQRDNNVTIHWCEPRIYANMAVGAYQVSDYHSTV